MTSPLDEQLDQNTPKAAPAALAIEDGYRAVRDNIDISKGQKHFDEFMDIVSSPVSKAVDALESFNDWYEDNQATVLEAATSITSLDIDSKGVENAISAFGETARVVIKGLDVLSELHPFIAVAVVAFKLVISLDLARRDNNKKVIALKIQMQETMTVLFQLRHIHDPQEVGPDGTTIQDRMQELLKKIAEDIKETGSACDHYMKKGILAKTVKSKIYEGRLAKYGSLFIKHREKLELALTVHTALGVDAANDKLDAQGEQVAAIDEKLDMLLLLRKLDSPREKEIQRFIDERGGAKACIENETLLKELVDMSGEGFLGFTGGENLRGSEGLAAARKALGRELAENIDDALRKNIILFERKLEAQNRQLKEQLDVSFQVEGEHIITAILSGAHDRITDKDIRTIWKDMGWKGSVKARHFVLGLHDYYTGSLSATAPALGIIDSYSSFSTTTSDISVALTKPDRWALTYINIAHVQAILEAVDDDGTGFISVAEVNTFAASRPEGWTLPHWLAYWSAGSWFTFRWLIVLLLIPFQGWHMSIDRYKNKIYRLVQTMSQWINDVLPLNRNAIDEYFGHWVFVRLELLLRSTQTSKDWRDPNLKKLTTWYTDLEEDRLDQNLQFFGYQIDAEDTVALITGPGRVERYVYPLLYLLLKRHLSVIHLATTHVLDPDELVVMQQSLSTVFEAVDERIEILESIMKQSHPDVRERLGNFAFGSLQLLYGESEWEPSKSSYITWSIDDEAIDSEVEADVAKLVQDASTDNLVYPVDDTLTSTAYEFDSCALNPDSDTVGGLWAGHFYVDDGDEEKSSQGLCELYIEPAGKQGIIFGKAQNFSGVFTIVGSVSPALELELTFTYDHGHTTQCTGKLDPMTNVMSGNFTNSLYPADTESKGIEGKGIDEVEVSAGSKQRLIEAGVTELHWKDVDARKDEIGDGRVGCLDQAPDVPEQRIFYFCRTPASLFRYRYTTKQFKENRARARWSFACAAVLHQVRQRLWSWSYLKARLVDQKRYFELAVRNQKDLLNMSPYDPLTEIEGREMVGLNQNLHPSDTRFYSSLASLEILRTPQFPGVECDGCSRSIINGHLFCVTCINDVYADRIDLCLSCVDVVTVRDGFTHDVAHPLVKVNHTIHDGDLAWVVPEARIVCSRVKTLFRSMESVLDRPEDRGNKDKRGTLEALCCCCGIAVWPSCWACVYCAPDTFICDTCESQKVPALPDGISPWHLVRHPLVKIRDSREEVVVPNMDTRLAYLEQKVAELETNMEGRLAALDVKVEERLAALDAKVDARFTALESLIIQRLPSR